MAVTPTPIVVVLLILKYPIMLSQEYLVSVQEERETSTALTDKVIGGTSELGGIWQNDK